MTIPSAVHAILNPLEAFGQAVLTDVKAWLGGVETVVVDDAKVAWLALWPILSSIGPQQWAILQGLVSTVSADLAADDFAGMVGDVLKQAEAKELAWVGQLSTSTLTIIVSALQGSKLPPGS